MSFDAASISDNKAVADVLERLAAATEAGMAKVNALILERSRSHVELVPELARYLVESGGKRLRPMLTLASCSLFGPGNGNQVNYAAAVEFMHNATLLHDDVVDESDMRRGRSAARKIWGNQASILVGDFLLGQAFLMMVETGDLKALHVLSRAASIIAEGEVFQLAKSRDLSATREDYAEVIRAKTATLFEAATIVGTMAGGGDAAAQTALGTYGLELGWAFQLVDDVLDYGGASGRLGKNTGDDLREGKMTLPVILALETGSDKERALIAAALGDAEVSTDTIAEIVAIMEHHGALAETLFQAHAHAKAAKRALDALPASPLRAILAETADFCVSRAY
jgi:octaprenyl-diphosphate synthase